MCLWQMSFCAGTSFAVCCTCCGEPVCAVNAKASVFFFFQRSACVMTELPDNLTVVTYRGPFASKSQKLFSLLSQRRDHAKYFSRQQNTRAVTSEYLVNSLLSWLGRNLLQVSVFSLNWRGFFCFLFFFLFGFVFFFLWGYWWPSCFLNKTGIFW